MPAVVVECRAQRQCRLFSWRSPVYQPAVVSPTCLDNPLRGAGAWGRAPAFEVSVFEAVWFFKVYLNISVKNWAGCFSPFCIVRLFCVFSAPPVSSHLHSTDFSHFLPNYCQKSDMA